MDEFGKVLSEKYGPFRKTRFTAKQKAQLRPIAEVLALIDGNAFFGMSTDENGEDNWYEQYLPEAWAIYNANGGDKGWASMTSWMRDLEHENDTVRDAHAQWRLLKKLCKR